VLAHLDFPLADLIGLVVSQENSCRFCFAISNYLLRVQGMSDERIAELQAKLAKGTLEPRAAAAVAFARRMARSQPLVTADDRRKVRDAGFSSEEILELAFVVAFLSFVNRLNTIPAIPPGELEQLPDRWFFRMMRPLMASMIAKHRKRGQPIAPVPERAGFYAEVVRAFGALPAGQALAQTLEGLWSSSALTRRCKALLIAVVAKGLGCSVSMNEARALLRAEGVSDAVAEQALTHLNAPELDATENLLLPFARDTIWFQPAPMQRRARELSTQLTPAQFVEAVGVTSLANALCRLAPAVLES
jgi:AhpD family alkylhydroperoxidase